MSPERKLERSHPLHVSRLEISCQHCDLSLVTGESQKGSRCHLLTADLGRSCRRGGASPERLCLSVTEQQTGRQQMGTDRDVTQTMMDGYPLVSPKLLPLHFTRCSREVQGRGRRSNSTRAGDSAVKPIISSGLMLHSLLIPGPKPEKEALGYVIFHCQYFSHFLFGV